MKIWSKQLLIKPDPTPYLMASRSVRLLAAPGTSLLWPSTPQLLSDTLSKKTVGQAPFEFSFSVHADVIGTGTVFLLDMPGLVNVKAEDNTLMFKFSWLDGWRAVPASVLVAGWNEVTLIGDGLVVKLNINGHIYTLLDASPVEVNVLNYLPQGVTVGDTEVTGLDGGYILLPMDEVTGNILTFGTAGSWEIGAAFVYEPGSSSYNGVYGSQYNYYYPELNINQSTNKLYVNLSNSGSSRDIADTVYADYTLTVGKKYWTKLYFDGAKYGIKISDDGSNFQDFTIAETTTKVYDYTGTTYKMIFMNRRVENGQNVWLKGPLSALSSDTYIIMDGQRLYEKTATITPVEYPTIATGQLAIIQNWTKVKNIRAANSTTPEPEPDTPKEWYPGTGVGDSVWTPDDIVKPNDPVYDTESNATTNDGSTGRVDTVVSVLPDGSGFTGNSGTDYTGTYTPPAPEEYSGAVACLGNTKLVDGYNYNSATYPPEPKNNCEFGYTKVTVKDNSPSDYTFTDNIVYSDSKCTNRFGTIISHTSNATIVQYDETWSFTQEDGTVLTGVYTADSVSVTGSCLNEAPVNNTLGLLNVFDGVVSTYKITDSTAAGIPDELKGELYVSITDTGYGLTTKVHTFFMSGEFPISYISVYYHDPITAGETAYELGSTTGDYINDAYVVIDGNNYSLTFIGNKLATQY